MGNGASENYRRWFEYEQDSHAKTLASLTAVPESLLSAAAFQKAIDLMAHIVAARMMWLYRFGAAKEPIRELFPANVPLSELAGQVDAMQAAWSAYLSRLTDAEVERIFEYRSYDEGRFRNSVEDILTQLFGHSWYHRGQIAQLLRSMGAEPAVTDFVFWAREPVPDKTEQPL